MQRVGVVLLVGAAAAGLAVGVLLLAGVSLQVVPMGALGAAIPVAFTYAVVTAAD
ncbi:hypothetical protein [Halorubrum halophilum]|uniref:hypothetical protein n=1 Tax=Halorubrum halophilum TaxID=413816 RepID=UPI00186B2E94|nr:hypothetical protein [Halorubrum halophilum]